MGLSVKVGLLSSLLKGNDRDAESLQYEFGQVNEELKARGLPQHDEPINLSGIESRSSCVGYPYSFWRVLQRFAARLADDPEWVPTPLKDDEDPTYDQAVIDQSLEFKSHLLCHSPSEGYYLPIDFGEVIFFGKTRRFGLHAGFKLCTYAGAGSYSTKTRNNFG